MDLAGTGDYGYSVQQTPRKKHSQDDPGVCFSQTIRCAAEAYNQVVQSTRPLIKKVLQICKNSLQFLILLLSFVRERSTHFTSTLSSQALSRVRILSNMRRKLVSGVGLNDSKEPVVINGRATPAYDTWTHMLGRCYSPKYHRSHPTYIGCSVCHDWLLFSNFRRWFDNNYIEGFALDKDILIKNNKIYSPDACRFVPHHLNNLLLDRGRDRGRLPLGVTEIKSKRRTPTYEGLCRDGQGHRLRKTFKTVEDAVNWYANTKTKIIKEQTLQAFDNGWIKSDIAEALLNRVY